MGGVVRAGSGFVAAEGHSAGDTEVAVEPSRPDPSAAVKVRERTLAWSREDERKHNGLGLNADLGKASLLTTRYRLDDEARRIGVAAVLFKGVSAASREFQDA